MMNVATSSPVKENNRIRDNLQKVEKSKRSKSKSRKKNSLKDPLNANSQEKLGLEENFADSDDGDVTLCPEDFKYSAKTERSHQDDDHELDTLISASARRSFRKKYRDEDERQKDTVVVPTGINPKQQDIDEDFAFHRSGTDLSCCSSFCFEEMKGNDRQHTITTGDFGFLDFSKEMGGASGLEREETMNLIDGENNREVRGSRQKF